MKSAPIEYVAALGPPASRAPRERSPLPYPRGAGRDEMREQGPAWQFVPAAYASDNDGGYDGCSGVTPSGGTRVGVGLLSVGSAAPPPAGGTRAPTRTGWPQTRSRLILTG